MRSICHEAVSEVLQVKSLVMTLRLLTVISKPLLLVLARFSQVFSGEPHPVAPLVMGMLRLKSSPRVTVV